MEEEPMRPTEVKRVVPLLEHEAEDTESLAKAIIKTIDEMRRDYESWSINISMGGLRHSMGPFGTENAAAAAAMSMLGTLDRDEAMKYVTKMVNPRLLDAPEVKARLKTWCTECQHPMVAHDWPSSKVPRGCMVGYVAGDRDSGCQCGR
jgi:hypothetical protein